MDFLQALQDLFQGDDINKTLAVISLLAASFLLGLFLHWLFFSLPRARRQKREINTLKLRNETLEKEGKDLSDRFAAQGQKMSQLEDDMSKMKSDLSSREKHIQNLNQRLTEREAELKNAEAVAQNTQNELAERIRLYKYAQAEAQAADERAKEAQKNMDDALVRVEEMKGLVEEVEAERNQAVADLQTLQDEHQALGNEYAQLKMDSQRQQAELGELSQKAAELDELSNQVNMLNGVLESERRHIFELESMLAHFHAQELRLQDELNVYQQAEQAELETQLQEDALFDAHLEQAARIIDSVGIVQQDEEQLIEDPELLQRRLQAELNAPRTRALPVEPPAVELNEEDHEQLDQALDMAQRSMNREGFYTEMHPDLFLDLPQSQESEDEILSRSLEWAKASMGDEGVFEDIEQDWLVESPEQLQARLLEDERKAALRPRALPVQEPEVVLSSSEEEQMERSLRLSQAALDAEGFYTYIHPEKLQHELSGSAPQAGRGLNTPPSEQDQTPQPPRLDKYKTEIERSVVLDLGKRIPLASEAMKDDLKKIEGIGTFIEQKLNHLGIYTYEQVSKFDQAFIQKIAAAIGFSEKTIYNDRWVEQAERLMTKQQIQLLTKDVNINKLFKK